MILGYVRLVKYEKRKKGESISKTLKIVFSISLKERETETFFRKVIVSLNAKGSENFQPRNSSYL